jgi:capsular polysaccharide export protein
MTSLIGFEALLRGRAVTCAGLPFYAGWGLTTDLADPPERRKARPDMTALAFAALISYPRYWDPVIGAPTSPEAAVAALAQGITARRGLVAGLLAIGRRRR